MNNSPLGKYAAPAAAVAALTIIAAALIGLMFGAVLNITDAAQSQLNLLAALAAGALFGSSVAVNGYKGPLEAANRNIDSLAQAATANRAAIIATDTTGEAQNILTKIEAAMTGRTAVSLQVSPLAVDPPVVDS